MSQPARNLYEVYICTTPEKLWDAITNGALTQQYFYGGILNDGPLSPGSPMTYRDGEGAVLTDGKVLEIDPPRKLVQTWSAAWMPAGERDPDSKITWEITQLGDACKLAITHEHPDGETETAKSTTEGWPIILSGLKTLVETGKRLEIKFPEEAATA
jgi:uncharacterized protein YndB with AHSA1/START domain